MGATCGARWVRERAEGYYIPRVASWATSGLNLSGPDGALLVELKISTKTAAFQVSEPEKPWAKIRPRNRNPRTRNPRISARTRSAAILTIIPTHPIIKRNGNVFFLFCFLNGWICSHCISISFWQCLVKKCESGVEEIFAAFMWHRS